MKIRKRYEAEEDNWYMIDGQFWFLCDHDTVYMDTPATKSTGHWAALYRDMDSFSNRETRLRVAVKRWRRETS